MEYKMPMNGTEQVFKCLFHNKEGMAASKQGIETDGIDEYFFIGVCVLNVSQLESYYETTDKFQGKTILNVRTKSGDEWSLLYSLADMMALKKTSDYFNN